MSGDKLPCLGKFKTHSCYPWVWSEERNRYYQECSLMGCSFSETAESLVPIGPKIFIGEQGGHTHDWTVWESTATPDGLYTPPWLYKRRCRACLAEQMAENLKNETDNNFYCPKCRKPASTANPSFRDHVYRLGLPIFLCHPCRTAYIDKPTIHRLIHQWRNTHCVKEQFVSLYKELLESLEHNLNTCWVSQYGYKKIRFRKRP